MLSHYFLAFKRTGGFHPILNLKGLNPFLRVDKFRMETLESILKDLRQGHWMVSLDLKDTYLHVPICASHRKFLRFALKDSHGVLRIYKWMVLSFGLATAPRVFTMSLAPLAAHLHPQDHVYVPIHRQYLSRASFSFRNGDNQGYQCQTPSPSPRKASNRWWVPSWRVMPRCLCVRFGSDRF